VAKKKEPDPSPKPAGPPRKARCPRCGKEFLFTTVAEHKVFPFCSQRCRDVDLGNWLTGKYAIPGEPVDIDPDEQPEAPEVHDDAT
jgi:uncharacterized protein